MKSIIRKMLRESLNRLHEDDVDWDLHDIMDECRTEAYQQLEAAI
jgi:hypothetical protein